MSLPEVQDLEKMQKDLVSKFFHGLANPVRLQIALSLMNQEKNVGELVDELEMKQSQISNQLACLKTCGFVTARKEGKFVYYKVSDPRVQEIIHLAQSVVADNANLISSCIRL
ncbi:ArsR/SmtB family transcription factor [Terrihalobacillus insolitus]|uniref:ArsR/SmtB family transcription factor n=1 Tax=Terrihalobacillus insolitus TaxID=2950438 RepID=UPI0023424B4C|nr:metalloregulator ArsR/SmtB family transcription factor [Terrihalobacillus insolitus]MDC3412943.1 metalloregulator ArsR/SmtB family transcription factor [Terrihalobacillus insolitus]